MTSSHVTPVPSIDSDRPHRVGELDAQRLMAGALRHLERLTHEVAPALIRHRMHPIPAERVDESAERFVAAVRACVHEELAPFLEALRAELQMRPGA